MSQTNKPVSDVCVVADSRDSNPDVMEYAARFCDQFDAHLTAIYVKPFTDTPSTYHGVVPDLYATMADEMSEVAEIAKKDFEAMAQRYDIRSTWREDTGPAERRIIEALRYADIGIVGQSTMTDDHYVTGWVNRLVLGTGRPMIIVPQGGWNGGICQKIVVAWDESQAATRAVHDALPLLESCSETVDVVHIQGNGRRNEHLATDLCQHLARHGIDANAFTTQANSVEPGHALITLANVDKADMLVMGAWGHSRPREFIFGGVTRTMLSQLAVPVFMSH